MTTTTTGTKKYRWTAPVSGLYEFNPKPSQQIVKKGKLSFSIKDKIFDWKILWKQKPKKLFKFKSLKKYD